MQQSTDEGRRPITLDVAEERGLMRMALWLVDAARRRTASIMWLVVSHQVAAEIGYRCGEHDAEMGERNLAIGSVHKTILPKKIVTVTKLATCEPNLCQK